MFGLEAIDVQNKDKYIEFDNLFTKMRSDVVLNDFTNARLNKKYSNMLVTLLKSAFGIRAVVRIANIRNAHVMPLYANDRHVLANANLRKLMDKRKIKLVSKTVERELRAVKGTIDTKRAKIGGSFTMYKHEIVFDAVFFFGILHMKHREVVGILFHEVGHAFHMIEYSHKVTDINVRLYDISRLAQTNAPYSKYEYLLVDMGLDDSAINLITSSDTRIIMSRNLSKAVYEKQQTIQNNYKYSQVSNESLADQFATRCGYGLELVAALNKFTPTVIINNSISDSVVLTQLKEMTVALGILSLFVGSPIGAIISLGIWFGMAVIANNSNNTNMTYDDGVERFRAIRNDVMRQLKMYEHNLSKDEKMLMITTYDDINKMMDEHVVTRTMSSIVGDWLSFSARAARKDIESQRRLENLASSPLYIEALRLSLL